MMKLPKFRPWLGLVKFRWTSARLDHVINESGQNSKPADGLHLGSPHKAYLVQPNPCLVSHPRMSQRHIHGISLPMDVFGENSVKAHPLAEYAGSPVGIECRVVPGVTPAPKDPVYISVSDSTAGMITNSPADGEIELGAYEFLMPLSDEVWVIKAKESVLELVQGMDEDGEEEI
jgi:hypothetical protein